MPTALYGCGHFCHKVRILHKQRVVILASYKEVSEHRKSTTDSSLYSYIARLDGGHESERGESIDSRRLWWTNDNVN